MKKHNYATIDTVVEDRVLILDASEIATNADYGGMLYELKNLGIVEGEAYQVDNAGNLLMYYQVYVKCRTVLNKFNVTAVNPS